jgi:hypothetical protein
MQVPLLAISSAFLFIEVLDAETPEDVKKLQKETIIMR